MHKPRPRCPHCDAPMTTIHPDKEYICRTTGCPYRGRVILYQRVSRRHYNLIPAPVMPSIQTRGPINDQRSSDRASLRS